MSSDGYEGQYMAGGGGTVLRRDKVVGRRFQFWMAVPALWCLLGTILTFSGLLGPATWVGVMLGVLTAFFAFLWATLSVIRTVVSDREVFVQYGLWGPRVPIERVRSCRVVDYDWASYGGWGMKRSPDGTWAYVISNGKVVELTWQAEDGIEKKALFSADDAVATVTAIHKAMEMASNKGLPRVRVESEPPKRIDAELEDVETDQGAAEHERRENRRA